MNPALPPPVSPPPVPPRRRLVWPWVLGAVLLSPFLFVAVAAYGYLTLERDASVLRREIMRATNADWHTKAQVSVGRPTLAVARSCLAFVKHDKIDEARMALAAVKSASVGVYELQRSGAKWSGSRVINEADKLMARRGWTRFIGVADGREVVLVYAPKAAGEPREFCLAVVGDRELIVVSAEIDAGSLGRLVEKVTDGKLRTPWRNLRL